MRRLLVAVSLLGSVGRTANERRCEVAREIVLAMWEQSSQEALAAIADGARLVRVTFAGRTSASPSDAL